MDSTNTSTAANRSEDVAVSVPEVQPLATPAEPVTQSNTTVPAAPSGANETVDYLALGSFILSLFNLCSWFIPLFGCPMSLVAIGLGIAGRKSSKYKKLAIAGIVISVIAFIATIVNSILGVAMVMENGSFAP